MTPASIHINVRFQVDYLAPYYNGQGFYALWFELDGNLSRRRFLVLPDALPEHIHGKVPYADGLNRRRN